MDLSVDRIYRARENLKDIVVRTPLSVSEGLSGRSGGRVYLKWENLQMTGSFKIRGALNKMLLVDREDLSKGVITASAGNHAQGVAWGAKHLAVPATAVMPVSTPRTKVEGTERLGARVVLFGPTYDEAHERCLELSASGGMTYIPACEDADVMAGHGTVALEILEDLPEVDRVLVPVGGGGLISGIACVLRSIRPQAQVIGVQSTQACTMYHCFRAGRQVSVPVFPTLAEGLAGGIEETNLQIIRETVEDILLAEEEGLPEAIRWTLRHEHQVVEASGVVGVAAVLQGRVPGLEGKKVVIIVSGGNIDSCLLRRIVFTGDDARGDL